MARILNKIGDANNEIRKINDNFDRLSLDISDRSGTFSSVAGVSGMSLASGSSSLIEISVQDVKSIYEFGRLPLIFRYDLFINNDSDFTYSWPLGGNLSGAIKHGVDVTVFQSKTVLNTIEDEKATILVKIKNTSGVSIDYYFYLDAYYIPAPEEGVAARPVQQ